MTRFVLLQRFLLLLSVAAAHGVAAAWYYSIVCPPATAPNSPEYNRCDIILLAGDEPTTVTISTAESTETVTIQREYRWTAEYLPVEGGIEQKGISISSDVPISVYLAYVDTYYTPQIVTDATGIASVSSSQTSFHIVNHVNAPYDCPPNSRNEFFAIASSKADTSVTVTSPTRSLTFILELYETYSEIAESNSMELSDVTITSSAPTTVVSGNLCTFNYVGGSLGAGTYITNQRPVDQYSTQYVVPAIKAPRNSGYDVHVVASLNNTLVNIDAQQVELHEDEITVQTFTGKTTVTLITCSLPCNVRQFTKGYYGYDGLFIIDVIPTNEFYTRAVFTTSEENVDHHITVVVDSPTPVSDILLDGVLFDPVWSTAGDVVYATADVGEGYHVMNSSESRFSVYTYAQPQYSYGGYGFAVLPPDEELATTPTVSLSPTSVHPTVPDTSLPQYSITTNGTLVTEDGSDVLPSCAVEYNIQMDQQAKSMAATIDALIGREICVNQMPGDVLIKSVFSNLLVSGNKAQVYVIYSMDVNPGVAFSAIQECAGDIAAYVSSEGRWPDPILPGSAECEAMVLLDDKFLTVSSQWICPQVKHMDPESWTDNVLLYEIQVGDIMDTEDGSVLSPQCSAAYAQELTKQALIQAQTIESMISRGEMCASNLVITDLAPSSSLIIMGSQVFYTVTMVTQPGPDASFGEFLDCAFEIHTYVRTVSNWPDPPLPPQPGCPALITDTELMEDYGSGWSCVDKN